MMTDDELQKKYPLPPEMQELAETMLNGGQPVARAAAVGVDQMRVILQKLREDKVKLLAAIAENAGREHYDALLAQTFGHDLTELNREIVEYDQRLKQYELQQQGLN